MVCVSLFGRETKVARIEGQSNIEFILEFSTKVFGYDIGGGGDGLANLKAGLHLTR